MDRKVNQGNQYNYHKNVQKKAKGTALQMAVALLYKYSVLFILMAQKGNIKH